MNTENQIVVGSIVKFKNQDNDLEKNGSYRVSMLKGGKVNLKSVFGKTIYYKAIPVTELVDNEVAWYAAWQNSETYMCM